MSGLFQGLELGKRALLTHQSSLQTIGHNIANASTPGYSRQRVTVSPTRAEALPWGSIGTGIQSNNVRQIRDLFLGQQYREAQKSLGQWSYRDRTLSQIESLVNEPQDNAVGSLLGQFWDAWSALSTNADSPSNRSNVVSEANKLVNGLHQLSGKISNLRQSIDADLKSLTDVVNQKTAEIAILNQEISKTELGGTPANDLRDQRDLLTDELAKIVDVRSLEKPNGSTIVYMGGMSLVDGPDSFPIGVKVANDNGIMTHKFVWKGTDVRLTNLNGQLAGLLESRDTIIPNYLAQLDLFTKTLVTEVNAIHSAGYAKDGSTGIPFFDPTNTAASTIRVNPLIDQDSSKVVASSGLSSDNLVALALSDLRTKGVLSSNTTSLSDFYKNMVGDLGIERQESKSFSSNFELLVQQVDNSRQSVQGVSLDEEMANMLKYQHAYDAAARVITTMDQALDTVIHGMGVVGR